MFDYIVQIIFSGPLGSLSSLCSYLEKRVPLKPVQVGVPSVAHFVTGHEQIQLNRVGCFHFFGCIPCLHGI